ncbi:transcription factor GTE10-like [Iris pallida]|uniref:Transcription factor GTE10-like n=1 Tax=Iris pallida TaxID=29817 RepID=A0AAX6G7M3_IRIPA|nr:transcription factor GTE10-like [Iris pallida]
MAPTVLVEYTQEKTQKRSFAMMGKSQKSSRGFSSSSFVPDYRHAAETAAESEGPGSSCRDYRADSEDSCGPKRKCISLNKDSGCVFNVPLQSYPVSKMSAAERKGLKLQLRAELEQVREIQKKLKLRSTSSIGGTTLSSSCVEQDVKCAGGTTLSSSRVGQDRKLGSVNAANLKRGMSGRFQTTKHQPQQPPLPPPPPIMGDAVAAVMKQCESLLSKLMKHPFGWVFNNPVDAVALNIPDYYTVIKHPMDFGTIKKRIYSGGYSSPWGFVADVRLTFTNAMTYNPPGNDVHIMADKLSKFFEPKWKPIEKKLACADSGVRREMEDAKPVFQSKKRKPSPVYHHNVIQEKPKPKVLPGLRVELSDRLGSMIDDIPDKIIDFLRIHNKVVNEAGEEEIEVDIDALSEDKLLELKGLIDDYTQTRQRQVKAEPSGVETLSEPGLRNSSMHPCKGNEPIPDEDVDIGGNDPPISSYPPVEIEKDVAPKSSKCSSSSSSSSDSSSSSSDSDSGSSSGSESDERGASPAKAAEGSVRPNTALQQDMTDMMNPLHMNRSLDGVDKRYQGAPKPVSVEADAQQEGENAPSERQVSPDKLYRAALLRSRFADTILKAREKTLDKGEKGDPEKLRREREELERQQREEKARIQAEAKAAEAARKQAESEALAEAKRQREREREAARQALLRMEKTVEINENCLILKDLEMLGSVPGEHEPNCVDEMSPDHAHDGMGGFKLGGSNPLEQLGLFMKDDDDEEEEAEPRIAPTIDIEEGEID